MIEYSSYALLSGFCFSFLMQTSYSGMTNSGQSNLDKTSNFLYVESSGSIHKSGTGQMMDKNHNQQIGARLCQTEVSFFIYILRKREDIP
jgi:hypothetical protein